jgi:hypothetical protein
MRASSKCPGGNISVKQDGVSWIKASGTWLADALSHDIFVPVALQSLRQAIERYGPACESCPEHVVEALNPRGLRPSIETTMDAVLAQKIAVHVHRVDTIAWAIQEDAEAKRRRYCRASIGSLSPIVARACRSAAGSSSACNWLPPFLFSAITDLLWQPNRLQKYRNCSTRYEPVCIDRPVKHRPFSMPLCRVWRSRLPILSRMIRRSMPSLPIRSG